MSENDGKVLLSAPFLSNLDELALTMPNKARARECLKKLLRKTINLRKLVIFNDNADYLGSSKLEKLEELEVDLDWGEHGAMHFGPLLTHPRPSLRSLTVYNCKPNRAELELLLTQGKEALPNLNFLKITNGYELDGEERDDNSVPFWDCLSRIDLPNLIGLKIECRLDDLVGIAQQTAKVPKLQNLEVYCGQPWPPRDYEYETLQQLERLFPSPCIQQLETLKFYKSYFRLNTVRTLCKHASNMKILKVLSIRSGGKRGVEMIANAGEKGGFPNLEKIKFLDMVHRCASSRNPNGISWEPSKEIGDCLKKVWPNIDLGCCDCLDKPGKAERSDERYLDLGYYETSSEEDDLEFDYGDEDYGDPFGSW